MSEVTTTPSCYFDLLPEWVKTELLVGGVGYPRGKNPLLMDKDMYDVIQNLALKYQRNMVKFVMMDVRDSYLDLLKRQP